MDEDDASDASTWYADTDNDGYGDGGSATAACDVPSGYVAYDSEGDDADASVNPGESEVCEDGIDNDCDGAGCVLASASLSTAYQHTGEAHSDRSGRSVSGAGDVNDDGYDGERHLRQSGRRGR